MAQFAVQQQTGGAQSYSISKWMNQVTTQFFDENSKYIERMNVKYCCSGEKN